MNVKKPYEINHLVYWEDKFLDLFVIVVNKNVRLAQLVYSSLLD